MTNETNPVDLRGVHMSHCNQGDHEGSCKYGDDDCPALAQSQPAATVQQPHLLHRHFICAVDALRMFDPAVADAIKVNYEKFAALTAEPAAKAGDARSISVAEEWAVYMDVAVSKAPEPLRQLGEYLAGLLDEDQWKTAERYLNGALLATPSGRAQGEWLPIETAPKDGTPFFAKGRDWGQADGRIHYNVAVWNAVSNEWRSWDEPEQALAYLVEWFPTAAPPAQDQTKGDEA